MRHNKQQRQLGALIRVYRLLTPRYATWLRSIEKREYDMANLKDIAPGAFNRATELQALERRLPPEMVAWAKLNR